MTRSSDPPFDGPACLSGAAQTPTPPDSGREGPLPGWTELLLLLGAGALTLLLLVASTIAGFAWLIVPMVVLSVWIADRFRRLARRHPGTLGIYVGVSGAVAIVSVLTGWLNGLSDEPYSTPAYASLGWSTYTHPVSFDYLQYGQWYHEVSFDVYLPGLSFVQFPGLDYRWVALAAWAGMVYLRRKDPFFCAGLSTPWIAIMAANGQNDFIPLLALTVSLLVRPHRLGFLAEIAALGLKQLANVLVFFYHLVRGEFRRAGLAVAVTVLILLPFLWIDPGSVYCHVIVGDPGTTCRSHPWTFFIFKRNYWLYPVWAWLAFEGPIRQRISSWWRHARQR